MKNKLTNFLNRLLIILPACALLLTISLSMTGCTKKEASDESAPSSEGSGETILENEGDLEISVPEDEETFGE